MSLSRASTKDLKLWWLRWFFRCQMSNIENDLLWQCYYISMLPLCNKILYPILKLLSFLWSWRIYWLEKLVQEWCRCSRILPTSCYTYKILRKEKKCRRNSGVQYVELKAIINTNIQHSWIILNQEHQIL